MKKHFAILSVVLISFILFSNIQAQTEISAEKKKLIGELITLTKVDKQVVEMTDVMLKSMENVYPSVVEQTISGRTELSEQDKKAAIKSATESFQAFSKKFRERLPQRIDYRQYIEDSVYPLYDKFFTEKEIADLVGFYKTETGQKIIATMPQLIVESSKMSETILLPKLLKLIDEIIQEDLQPLRQPPPPARRKTDQ